MGEIGLKDTIDALRDELLAAMEQARDKGVQFPVTGVQLEFHVGVKKTGEGKAGLKFWVLELGSGGSFARETIQKVIVTLGAPTDSAGVPVKVSDVTEDRP
ncbi:trypco2 family protein [Lentzea sp. BCCO 10_0856]|uniref:Trypco2 family protein n=1 Tax=Lentzea miocenica TaxID=3095431 RepID=A0ABU4SZU1_9PSEU|nr:trypco2 family protein [Lentzea sp. BCCO 10_0856]MDX8031427.1 trypco2 family protein [Lentzea sp. BCCO 10_0856]